MFAIIAAVLFGLSLLLTLIGESLGTLVTPNTLNIAGFLFVALHLAGAASWRGRRG